MIQVTGSRKVFCTLPVTVILFLKGRLIYLVPVREIVQVGPAHLLNRPVLIYSYDINDPQLVRRRL